MKVNRTEKDVYACLAVFTTTGAGKKHAIIFSEPDEKGMREVYFDDIEEGRGRILGAVSPVGLGYTTNSSFIEVGRSIGIEFPDRPKSDRILMLSPVTAVIVMTRAEAAIASC